MPTVQEILKQTGFTDEQIAGLDARAINAFGTALTTAEQDRKAAAEAAAKAEAERQAAKAEFEKAELVKRSNKDFYEGTIVTALNSWEEDKKKIESERARAAAEAAFYKTQAETAKSAGFIPAEAPAFTYTPPAPTTPSIDPTRGKDGRYVSNAPGSVPGSPTLIDDVRSYISDTSWAQREYQKLFNSYLPDDPIQLAAEAGGMKLPFRDYVARKYNFSGKQEEIVRQQQEAHDNEVRAAAAKEFEEKLKAKEEEHKANLDKARQEWAERSGSNPDVRTALPSKMQEVARAVQTGDRPDPLKMSNLERHQITRRQINERIAEQGVA